MTCPRCIGGCLHFEQLEWGEPYIAKCLNCGARPGNVPYPEKVREPYQRKDKRICRNCTQLAVLGKSYCQAHLDYMTAYRKRTRRKKGQAA